MIRRDLLAYGLGVAVASGAGFRSGQGVLAEATPESGKPPACDLDLDAADYSATIAIPIDVDESALDGVEQTLLARIHALGFASCSVDRSDRSLLVNLQLPNTAQKLDAAAITRLLTDQGRIDLVDGGVGSIEVGDRIETTPLPPDAPEINVVYETIVTNADFVSVRAETSDFGESVVRFVLTPEAAERLARFTRANAGAQMPLVMDGIVEANPIVQTEISDEFDLQPVEPELSQRLVVFGSGDSYPAPLEVVSVRDARATPDA